MSSPESMVHREQDFDYEVIEAGGNNPYGFMQTQVPVAETPISAMDDIEDSSISVADHYKGTPPLRSKKKGKNSRLSHEIPSDFQVRIEVRLFEFILCSRKKITQLFIVNSQLL